MTSKCAAAHEGPHPDWDARGMSAPNPNPDCGLCGGRGWTFGIRIGRVPDGALFACTACLPYGAKG